MGILERRYHSLHLRNIFLSDVLCGYKKIPGFRLLDASRFPAASFISPARRELAGGPYVAFLAMYGFTVSHPRAIFIRRRVLFWINENAPIHRGATPNTGDIYHIVKQSNLSFNAWTIAA